MADPARGGRSQRSAMRRRTRSVTTKRADDALPGHRRRRILDSARAGGRRPEARKRRYIRDLVCRAVNSVAPSERRHFIPPRLSCVRVGTTLSSPRATPVSSCLLQRTNLSSTRRAAGVSLASPGDPVAQFAPIVLELDFCVPERAGTRAALNDTGEMDELGRVLPAAGGTSYADGAPPQPTLPLADRSSHDFNGPAPPAGCCNRTHAATHHGRRAYPRDIEPRARVGVQRGSRKSPQARMGCLQPSC